MVGIYILKKKKKSCTPNNKTNTGHYSFSCKSTQDGWEGGPSPAPKDLAGKILQCPTSEAKCYFFFFFFKVKFLLSDLLGKIKCFHWRKT